MHGDNSDPDIAEAERQRFRTDARGEIDELTGALAAREREAELRARLLTSSFASMGVTQPNGHVPWHTVARAVRLCVARLRRDGNPEPAADTSPRD